MKNFALLSKNCVGFTPSSTVNYIQKCKHPSHTEKVFAGMLKYAITKINEAVAKERWCYLYNQPQNQWPEGALAALANAETIHEEKYGTEAQIRVYKFRGEEKLNYYFIKGEQLGEKFEILFLEEL